MDSIVGKLKPDPGVSHEQFKVSCMEYLSFIDLERGGFGEILPEVMIFPEGLCPEGNINTEGNISPNSRAEGL
jgi:hypothetical protein